MKYPGEKQVALVSGEMVSNYSPAWLQETGARHAEAIWLVRAPDAEAHIPGAVMRLGGGAENERRLRAAMADIVRVRLDEFAREVLAAGYIEERRAAAAAFERRWGEELGSALRERVKAMWEARRTAAALDTPEGA